MLSTESTLSERMQQLRRMGYTEDFNLKSRFAEGVKDFFKILPDDFKIDLYYRFEGDSDPADEAIIYAISSERHHLKGILVNGYGVYSDPVANEILKKLKVN